MCLAIPGQIQSIEGNEMERTGKVSFALSVVIVLLVWRLASADRKATLCAANACR